MSYPQTPPNELPVLRDISLGAEGKYTLSIREPDERFIQRPQGFILAHYPVILKGSSPEAIDAFLGVGAHDNENRLTPDTIFLGTISNETEHRSLEKQSQLRILKEKALIGDKEADALSGKIDEVIDRHSPTIKLFPESRDADTHGFAGNLEQNSKEIYEQARRSR